MIESGKENSSNHNYKIILLITAILITFAAFISFKNLENGFYWDDFHLIRSFTSSELKAVWHGNWDPDNIETPGYRPLTPLFNNLRYHLFGENVVCQRIFLVLLFVIILIAWAGFLQKVGLSNLWSVFIPLLVLSAKNSAYHFNWISDGIHLIQGFFFIICIWLLYVSVSKRSKIQSCLFSALSLVTYAISLLIREDSLVIFGAVILLYFYLLYSDKAKKSGKFLLLSYSIYLLVVWLLY